MFSVLLSVWRWLGQEGPSAKKHQGWVHPLVVMILHYLIVISVSLAVHDAFFGRPSESTQFKSPPTNISSNTVAQVMTIYFIWLFLWRLFVLKQQPSNVAIVLYEMNWLCNVTLLVGPLALATQRPRLVMAYSFVIGIDQCLWYIDLLGYFMHRLVASSSAR
jgi:quinol-cytochrome oxidoreductase complex cytochrome b subunit